MTDDYYLRELTQEDWKKYQEMDLLIFPEETVREESYHRSLSGPKSLAVVAVEKETNDFIGYFMVSIYGKEGHVKRIGTHPNHLRKGVGSKLLERAIFHLKSAGCNEFFLYVKSENEAAIKLYEKFGFVSEERSYQFIIPLDKTKEKPRGRCRSVEWGEIQLLSLRFNLNPFRVQQFFGMENQHVLVFEIMGQQLGFCRFSPDFPGGMPFILKDTQYTMDFVTHLGKLVTNKEFTSFRVTFDGQISLYQKLLDEKMELNYELLKMTLQDAGE
ncbi:MAG: GNAT family N-acetyltransferase [Asgard group archaeon]|nr:GNAT family N-acetyltransferase [Asgard group archaeon]